MPKLLTSRQKKAEILYRNMIFAPGTADGHRDGDTNWGEIGKHMEGAVIGTVDADGVRISLAMWALRRHTQ